MKFKLFDFFYINVTVTHILWYHVFQNQLPLFELSDGKNAKKNLLLFFFAFN